MPRDEKDVAFDSLFTELGWQRKYHRIQLAFLWLPTLPIAFSVMSIIFIGYNIESRCKQPANESLLTYYNGPDLSEVNTSVAECHITVSSNGSWQQVLPCIDGHAYLQSRQLSLAAEWDLVCGKESLNDLLQTLHMVGMGLGSVVFTALADSYGRKLAHVSAGLGLLTCISSMAFVPTYTPFAVMKIFQGAFQGGCGLTGQTLMLEIVAAKLRSTVAIIITFAWGCSVVIYAAAAYVMRDLSWRYHLLISGLIGAYFLLMPWVMDESVRWLGSKNKYDRVEKIVRKAARQNGQNAESMVGIIREHLSPDPHRQTTELIKRHPNDDLTGRPDVETKEVSNTKGQMILLLKDSKLLTISMVNWFMWLTDSLTYYGLSLTSTEFHSNKYLGFGLNALMELASVFGLWLTVDRFGRKKTCLFFHVLAGLCLILSVVFGHFKGTYPSFSIGVTVLSLVGKFGINVTFNLIWLYTPEMFPTTVSFGLASLSARFGGLFAPFSRTLYRYYPWAPGTIFGSCCILVAILVRLLPETAGRELAQTVEEMKINLSKDKRHKDKHANVKT